MIYAAGDIHGQLDALNGLLKHLTYRNNVGGGALDGRRLEPDDQVIFLGDYVDRGQNSKAVIDRLIAFKRDEHPNTRFLKGNHEGMMIGGLDAARSIAANPFSRNKNQHDLEVLDFWLSNGGMQTISSYSGETSLKNWKWVESFPQEHLDWIDALESQIDTEHFTFVHAGLVPPGNAWVPRWYQPDPRQWIRADFIDSDADFGGKCVVFGHTPQRATMLPLVLPNKIGLDTGCAFDRGFLTLAAFDDSKPYDPLVYEKRRVFDADGKWRFSENRQYHSFWRFAQSGNMLSMLRSLNYGCVDEVIVHDPDGYSITSNPN